MISRAPRVQRPEVAVSAATRRPFASRLRVPRRVLAAASKDGEGKDTATKPTSSAQETTKETKDENPLERLTSLAGGLKIDTSSGSFPGIPKKNIDAYTEWRAVYKSLKDFGLESVSAEEASSLVAANKAVILDVRTDLFFDKQHAEPSVNVPYFDRVRGNKGGSFAVKRLLLGPNTTVKNDSFVDDVKAAVGSDKTVIVCCTTGGTIKSIFGRKKEREDSYVDSQRAFGRDSLSLRAANDLIEAGLTNVKHLEGGLAAWTAEELPVVGTSIKEEVKEEKKEDSEEEEADPNAWPAVHASLVAAEVPSVKVLDAFKLADSGAAMIVDVNSLRAYDAENIQDSVNVPFVRKVEVNGWRVAGGLSGLGSSEEYVESDPNFLSTFEKTGVGKKDTMVIVTCSRGGTLKTETVSEKGRIFKDPQLRFGRESQSLRAISALLGAGYENVAHLEGGNAAWRVKKLPMNRKFNGKEKQKIEGQDAVGWRVAIWFFELEQYFNGEIKSFDEKSGKYVVQFDGLEKNAIVDKSRIKWLSKTGGERQNEVVGGPEALKKAEQQRKLVLPAVVFIALATSILTGLASKV
ncbi:rhodanese-like domain-containing protein [Chloropicon roscoffensis]|uniref:Rhodanese-like domain-containing protein n=1 Tax=Chloropicon roscoffensis TaxID=1461544 RepID=A0AAX4P7U3_9CHLO